MENTLNKHLVEQILSYHGLPLIKAWNDENGSSSLINLGIQPNAIDTTIYHERLKNLNYTDRAKRMRLHQFMCSKSELLFKNLRVDPMEMIIEKLLAGGGESMPPLDFFSNFNHDERMSKFFMNIRPGDIAYGVIMQMQTAKAGLLVKILCTIGGTSSLVHDINIKGLILAQNLIPAIDSKSVTRQFLPNDYVCCEVLQISDEIFLGMQAIHRRFDKGPPLGLIRISDMPQFYKFAVDLHNKNKSYNQLLRETEGIKNPAGIEQLYSIVGLDSKSYYSLMSKNKFPHDELPKDLRLQQAGKLAFRSVAEGIGHFKEGRHDEAYQCLNKALTIDPRNVEGLVARGALNANSSRFQKAIVDFEAALKINANHGNAKKYLGETLLALGRNLEEENKLEDAQKAYIECLNINPHHQEALASLNYIKTKINTRKIVEPAELELPPLNIGSISSTLKESKIKDESRSKKSKKDKKKKGKKRHSSSSDSSSESSDSSESSSESTDHSSSSSSESRLKKKNKKRKSPSPVSKRIEIADLNTKYSQYGQSSSSFDPMDDHELKVKKFLEMSRDEDDYEEKVGQLIAEASKYQKTKQAEEAKSAKKKKKMEKKIKKDKKKKRREEKKKYKETDIDKIRDALKMFENLPDKIKKLYQEKIKEEDARQKQSESAAGSDEGKWKMKFSKTEGDAKSKKPNFSLYDSDDEDQVRNFQAHAPSQSVTAALNAYGNLANASKAAAESALPEIVPAPIIVNQGPIVLDKFGNFRRVEQPPMPVQSPPESSSRRSRSKGRRSRSRSSSRSPRRRRRRSSRSRSYSRSPGRGGRGGFRRGSNISRGGFRQRGRWNNDYRDNRDSWDYRRQDRPDRFDRRGGSRGGGNRFGGKYNRSVSRSVSQSPPRRKDKMDDVDRRSREGSKKDEVKW